MAIPGTEINTNEYPSREEGRGARFSACAALAAVDGVLFSEDEEKEGKEGEEEALRNRPHGRQHVAVCFNVRTSTPGAQITPFVSHKGD